MNNYKDLKRENQFKKKERESNKDLKRERERKRERVSIETFSNLIQEN